MERTIGWLLRIGVGVAAVLVSVGGVIYLWHHGSEMPRYQTFRGEPGQLRAIGSIARDAWAERGVGLIQSGLLVLIATPVMRVAYTLWAFARHRDVLYVAIAGIVLAVLLSSLFILR